MRGRIAQLVEHRIWRPEVGGSIPPVPTTRSWGCLGGPWVAVGPPSPHLKDGGFDSLPPP